MTMLYPFLTTPDHTEISFSEILTVNGKNQVRVYVEKWDEANRRFDCMELYLPDGIVTKYVGFTEKEAARHKMHIMHLQDIIWECAQEESNKIQKNDDMKKTND